MVLIDFIFFPFLEDNGAHQLWLPAFFKISSFVFNERKKWVWNNLRVRKL